MAARLILEGYAEKTGWNLDSMFEILCDYVDNQRSDDALEDFVAERVRDEFDLEPDACSEHIHAFDDDCETCRAERLRTDVRTR